MADEDDEVAMELEAVRYTYPELQTDDGSPHPAVAIDLAPRNARQAFVSARLWLGLGGGYPAAGPAVVRLRDARGLGDARAAEVVARLRGEAAELEGGPAVGRLVELCEELLSEFNAPEGAMSDELQADLLQRLGDGRMVLGAWCCRLKGPVRCSGSGLVLMLVSAHVKR